MYIGQLTILGEGWKVNVCGSLHFYGESWQEFIKLWVSLFMWESSFIMGELTLYTGVFHRYVGMWESAVDTEHDLPSLILIKVYKSTLQTKVIKHKYYILYAMTRNIRNN